MLWLSHLDHEDFVALTLCNYPERWPFSTGEGDSTGLLLFGTFLQQGVMNLGHLSHVVIHLVISCGL